MFLAELCPLRCSTQIDSIRFLSRSASRPALLAILGCGTTRSSDTARTATEQLLISDAVDRAIQSVSFAPLAGQTVYLDDSKLSDVVDKNYIVSTLRQHMLASGCILRDTRDQADFVVEARAGAVGTDRNDLLFGIPCHERAADSAGAGCAGGDSRSAARQSVATNAASPRFRCSLTSGKRGSPCGNRVWRFKRVRRTTSGCSAPGRFNTARFIKGRQRPASPIKSLAPSQLHWPPKALPSLI